MEIPIRHCLLALPGVRLAGVCRVLSHLQVLAQSERRLRELLPDAELVPVYDTAGSALTIRRKGLRDAAAVAGRRRSMGWRSSSRTSRIRRRTTRGSSCWAGTPRSPKTQRRPPLCSLRRTPRRRCTTTSSPSPCAESTSPRSNPAPCGSSAGSASSTWTSPERPRGTVSESPGGATEEDHIPPDPGELSPGHSLRNILIVRIEDLLHPVRLGKDFLSPQGGPNPAPSPRLYRF